MSSQKLSTSSAITSYDIKQQRLKNETCSSCSEKLWNKTKQILQGRGRSDPRWERTLVANYPPYIYPLQTAIFQGRANPAGYNRRQQNGMSEGQALAEYALKLFNFGHEKRALAAYLQAQRKDPTVFDQDPLHLWALSEIQFGAGNLTLAKEYYAALKQKHPGSMLAVLADLEVT